MLDTKDPGVLRSVGMLMNLCASCEGSYGEQEGIHTFSTSSALLDFEDFFAVRVSAMTLSLLDLGMSYSRSVETKGRKVVDQILSADLVRSTTLSLSTMAIKPPQLTVSDAEYDGLAATLKNDSGDVPLAARFRALFTLRAIGSHKAIDIIGQGGSLPFYHYFGWL